LNFKIEKRDAFRIVGVSHPLEKDLERCLEIVPKMWEQAWMGGTTQKLMTLLNSEPKGMFGVAVCNNEHRTSEYDNWKYFIAVPSTLDKGEYEEYTVPALTWAIFPGRGSFSTDLPELERRVYTEWLPGSGYELTEGPDIEFLLPTNNPEDAEFEIWLPIKRKD
jgi:AraC family transcriptional regulator